MLTTIFSSRGSAVRIRAAELLGQRRQRSPSRTFSCSRGVDGLLCGCASAALLLGHDIIYADSNCRRLRSAGLRQCFVLLGACAACGGDNRADARAALLAEPLLAAIVREAARRSARPCRTPGRPASRSTSGPASPSRAGPLADSSGCGARACTRGSRLRRRPCPSSRSTLSTLASRAAVVAGDHFDDIVYFEYASHHLARQADDLHEVAVAQLAGHGAENARAARIVVVVDDHHGVAVEPDVAAIGAARRLPACERPPPARRPSS